MAGTDISELTGIVLTDRNISIYENHEIVTPLFHRSVAIG
jgi:hypothetical protein